MRGYCRSVPVCQGDAVSGAPTLPFPAQRGLLDLVLGFWHNQAWMDMITRSFGPYQTSPLNINPLRDAIDARIDFDRVRAATDVEMFISATNAWTGKVAIFRRQELTADHLMASACLPTVFQAVAPSWTERRRPTGRLRS